MTRGRYLRRLLSIFTVVIMISTLRITGLTASGSGRSSVSAADITAQSFMASMNTGWNLGNSLDAHHKATDGEANLGQETVWGNPKVTKELIDFVRSKGFNTIRVPVNWKYHTYTDANGQLHVHPEWLARVKEVVNYCITDGMYVIMDSHHDNKMFYVGADEGDFASVCAKATTIWTDIATYFNDVDGHLIFEAYNEVDNVKKGRTFTKTAAAQMNQLNQVFVNAVRSTGGNNAQRLLIIPTLFHQYSDDVLTSFVLPKDVVPGKLLTAVHFYSQVVDQYLDQDFARLQQFAKRVGAPMVITEWGTTNKFSPSGYRTIHASNYIARAGARGLKCVYWDNGVEYAIIDRKNYTAREDMIQAMMNPTPFTADPAAALDNWSSSYLYMGTEDNGALKEWDSWGGMVLSQGESGLITIPQGASSLSMQLTVSGNMARQKFHYVYFYNDSFGLVDKLGNNFGFVGKNVKIPEGATSVRITIYNAFEKTSKESYDSALANGTIKPVVKFY